MNKNKLIHMKNSLVATRGEEKTGKGCQMYGDGWKLDF